MNFFAEIWTSYRPYAIRLLVDVLISFSFWVALFVFQKLEEFLPIVGWAAHLIDHLHSAGMVLAFLIFVALFIVDIWHLRSKK